jgi:hypothetical protein
MRIEAFTIEHYLRMGGTDVNLAVVCQQCGPAFTLIDGTTVLGIGGVRIQGIGEAWCMPSKEGKERPRSILENTRDGMTRIIADERLYRVFARETAGHPDWLEHLGFKKQDNRYGR